MIDASQAYLNVEEAASLLRVTPQTVYRWCRSGRVGAVKLGKEWRIPAEQFTAHPEPSGIMPADQLLRALADRSEHLLVCTTDDAALARMEATFLDVASDLENTVVVRERWNDETEDTIRSTMRPVLGRSRAGALQLRIINFAETYERGGASASVDLILHEAERAMHANRRLFLYGAPSAYFSVHQDRLAAYEREVNLRFPANTSWALCGYTVDYVIGHQSLELMIELFSLHTGVILSDGQRALLLRLAR